MVGRLDKRLRGYKDQYTAIRKENEPIYDQPIEDYYEPEEEYHDVYQKKNYQPKNKGPSYDDYDNIQLIPSIEEGPLSIIDEIKKLPTPKGAHPTVIHGVPVDLHVIEDYIIKISPYNIRTVNRYHSARTVEEIKGYGRFGTLKIKKMNVVLLILLIGMAILGIIMVMFMPQIMGSIQGMAP